MYCFDLTDKIIHLEHFDRNLFMKSFVSQTDDSWDKLLDCEGLLKFSLFRGGWGGGVLETEWGVSYF